MRAGTFTGTLPDASSNEIVETVAILGNGSTRVERIVSEGQASPPGFWYDQDTDEWVMVMTGGAVVEFADPGDEARLGPGDWLLIPAHRRHRVRSTLPGTLWLAVHAQKALE